jgi:hypothetical protein
MVVNYASSSVIYDRSNVYSTGHRGLCYKTLRTRNLQEIEKF